MIQVDRLDFCATINSNPGGFQCQPHPQGPQQKPTISTTEIS